MNRNLVALAGLALVQAILAAAIFWASAKPAGAPPGPLFGEQLKPADVTAFTVTNSDGESIHLAKQDGSWVLPDADGYHAKADTIESFLKKLSALDTKTLVARNPSSYKRLKVAENDYVRRVDLELADGSKRALYLGSSPRVSALHIRAAKQPGVYLTQELTSADARTSATSWIDTSYLDLSQDELVGLTIENEHGTLSFNKDDQGKWQLQGLAEGETLKESKITTLIRHLTPLRMKEPLGKTAKDSYTFDHPSATLTLTTRSTAKAGDSSNSGDGSADSGGETASGPAEVETHTYTIEVGAKLEDDYVVRSSESPYYVRVSNFNIGDAVTGAREDFLEAPPEGNQGGGVGS